MKAGSGRVKPLGGHIHISGVALDTNFLATLDQFIAKPLNEVSNTKLRASHGYGHLSAVDNAKTHGGFEYRSPLSWLSTPAITKGVIAIAWVLTQLQKDGRINHVQTWDDLYEKYPRKGHGKAIRRFTTTLADLKQRNIKLEDIEVLEAWEKRHLLKPLKKPVRTPRQRLIPVEWARTDSYLPEIEQEIEQCVGQLFSPFAIRIVGANQGRTSHKVIYLPRGWRVNLPRDSEIALSQWDLPWIGLSWSLRQEVPLAARVVSTVVSSVRPSV
jgi:hypothetical protein